MGMARDRRLGSGDNPCDPSRQGLRMTQDPAHRSSGTRLVNLSELDPNWNWLREPFRGEIPDWHHVTTQTMPRRLPVARTKEARWRSVQAAKALLSKHQGPRILVSHGPRPAAYWGTFAGSLALDGHDVYSFNYTDLPHGVARRVLSRAFRHVSEFVVASQWERELYSDHFGIPESRIRFQYWGVAAPQDSQPDESPLVAGDYICAIGSQARDYATLVQSMRLRPDIRLVIVATEACVQGIEMPSNVELRTHIPLVDAMNILRHSRLMALPMNSVAARCGHVTAVSALHMGVPVVATECRGLDDYLRADDTALVAEYGSASSMATAIGRLFEDPALQRDMGRRGIDFARRHCTEAAVIASFRESLRTRGLLT